MMVSPSVLIQIFSKRMLVDWPKCGSDPPDEGHLACLQQPYALPLLYAPSPLSLASQIPWKLFLLLSVTNKAHIATKMRTH